MNVEISAVVLTKNEEDNIKRCLNSLSWCNEVIVVDDYSDDQTRKIAKELGARVYRRELNNDFAAQRNFGLEKARGKWVLFVDADEVVPSELAREIKQVVETSHVKGYFIRRDNFWLGKNIKHGGMAGVKLVRLGMKGSGVWVRRVHEYWDINGKVGELSNKIKHYPHSSVSDMLSHVSSYFEIHAQENYREGKRSNIFRILLTPLAKFFNDFVLKLGFLDGMHGFVIAMIMSFHSFLSWSHLWFIQRKLKG